MVLDKLFYEKDASKLVQFIKDNLDKCQGVLIEDTYNLKSIGFGDHPLIIISQKYVYHLFWSSYAFALRIFKKEEFFSYKKDSFFYDPTYKNHGFDYLVNEEPLQVTITDTNYTSVTIDSQEYLTQIDLSLSNGDCLHVAPHELDDNIMEAWLDSWSKEDTI